MSEGALVVIVSVGIPLLVLLFVYRTLRRSGAWSVLTGSTRRTRKRLLTHGRPAKARIVDLGESGKRWMTTINGNPVVKLTLEIHDGNRTPYQATVTQLVSRLDVPQLQPGTWLAVTVDPNDPSVVALGSTEAAETKAVGNTELPDIKYGHEGTVTITGITAAGYKKKEQDVYNLQYEVHSPKHGNYTVAKDVPLPPEALDRLRINGTYSAQVDDYDRNRVVINVK